MEIIEIATEVLAQLTRPILRGDITNEDAAKLACDITEAFLKEIHVRNKRGVNQPWPKDPNIN